MISGLYHEAKSLQLYTWYPVVKGIQNVASGQRYPKVTYWSNVCKGYLMVQCIQIVSSGQRYPKVTYWSNVCKGYLMVQCIQKVSSGQRYPKGN